MILTAAQLLVLKNAILGDGTLSQIDHTSNAGYVQLADAMNVVDSAFFVYKSDVKVQDIYDQITWANLTPADAPTDTVTPANDTAITLARWHNRSLACQGKQFNLQIILQGQNLIDARKANVRAGLQDALTNIPSGASGAPISAGWVAVRDNVLTRKATRAEKLFVSGGNGATAATAATMAVEGLVTPDDISKAFT